MFYLLIYVTVYYVKTEKCFQIGTQNALAIKLELTYSVEVWLRQNVEY